MFVDIMGTLYNLRVFNGFSLLAETNSRVGKNGEIFSFLNYSIMPSTFPNKRLICFIRHVPFNLQFLLLTRATKADLLFELSLATMKTQVQTMKWNQTKEEELKRFLKVSFFSAHDADSQCFVLILNIAHLVFYPWPDRRQRQIISQKSG